MPSPLDNLDDLLGEAQSLNEAVKDGIIDGDVPSERTARQAHQLREVLGVALVLAERLARSTGNDPMVDFKDGIDGSGMISYKIKAESLSPSSTIPDYPLTAYCSECGATTVIEEDDARDHHDQTDTWLAVQSVLRDRGWHQAGGKYCPSCWEVHR